MNRWKRSSACLCVPVAAAGSGIADKTGEKRLLFLLSVGSGLGRNFAGSVGVYGFRKPVRVLSLVYCFPCGR